jgi:D-3-phosphoglycerate dehydrogenase
MSVKILANDGIADDAVARLEASGFIVDTNKREQEQLADAINNEGFKVVLVRSATKIRKELIDACPGLEMIGRGGVGMDNIDVEYAREKGITVFNTPASSSQAVAELVMACMFSLARGVYDADRTMPKTGATDFKALKKKYGKGIELRGKKLAVIGFGRIGQFAARYALGAGMEILAVDAFIKEPVEIDLQLPGVDAKVKVYPVSMDEALTQADFITLHVPAQADGSAVIGEAEFNKMKDGVRLVNLARGGVVDEDALLAALESGKVAAAALDVFENEPTPREELLTHPDILSTPHIGAATVEAQARIGGEIAENIEAKYA